jgi:LacI family transcriptional regulator
MTTGRRRTGVTSKDVARLAGVTQPTVSRALRNDPRVAPETMLRVIEAADKLGYVASDLGRSLSAGETRQIAMVADLDNPLYPQLVAPVHDELAGFGYRTVLFAERGDEIALYERLFDRSVDGVVLTTTRLRSSLPRELHERGLPFVFVNRVSERTPGDAVVGANADGARQVAELLLELGHRRIAAILGPAETSSARDRQAGFERALSEGGVELPPARVHHGWFAHRHGIEGFDAVWRGRHKPTAIFCVNDAVAIGVLSAASERGVSVPDDVAVVGFDDIDMASWPAFRLSTVHNPIEEMARQAVRLLVERLQGDHGAEPTHLELPVALVLRSTHG